MIAIIWLNAETPFKHHQHPPKISVPLFAELYCCSLHPFYALSSRALRANKFASIKCLSYWFNTITTRISFVYLSDGVLQQKKMVEIYGWQCLEE